MSVRRDASQTRRVDFKLQVREKGKIFRTQNIMAATTESGSIVDNFSIPLIIPSNADMRVVAGSSGATTEVEAVVSGYLATTDLSQLDGDV